MTLERHLTLHELTLPPSGEWRPREQEWFFVRIAEGAGYCGQREVVRELNNGDCFVTVFNGGAWLRASQLGPLKLQYFLVDPQFVSGLLTVMEWYQLETALNRPSLPILIHPATTKIAQAFTEAAEQPDTGGLHRRCRLLELWAEAVIGLLSGQPAKAPPINGLRARLRELVGEISDAELAVCSLSDLAVQLHCSERHFSRLFREEFGVPFRKQQIELRLLRARHLLSHSNTKIINVAYDSGYRHLGLFNSMFKKRFGTTPSEWRRNTQKNLTSASRRIVKRSALILLTTVLFSLAALGETHSVSETAREPLHLGTPVSAADMERAVKALHRKMLELDLRGNKTPTNATATTNAVSSATNAPTFEVKGYEITGNTLLPPEVPEIILDAYTGPAVSFDTIRKGLADLQMEYRQRGFVTVSVALPPQQLTNGIVKVQVTEGRLAEINVVNNRYFSSNNIMRALPGLHTNMMLNSLVLQRQLDAANGNRDRQIYPMLGPGPEPGTSALDLKVKDRLPLHGRAELNNQSTPGTPNLRLNLNAQYNNLWDREHQVGVQYSFTPEQEKVNTRNETTPLDRPLVANYSAYYRIPIGEPVSVQEQLDADPSRFGYNEATHQFQLPAISDRPALTFYASRSTVDTGVILGVATNAVETSSTNQLSIRAQDFSEDVSLNENLGTRFTYPWAKDNGERGSFSFGLDFKRYRKMSVAGKNFNINDTIVDPVTGAKLFETNYTLTLPAAVVSNAVDYLPIAVGADISVPDKLGVSFFNVGLNLNLLPGFSGDNDFRRAAYSTNTGAQYVTFNFGFTREQKIYKDWSVLLRANGQLATRPLIGNEQFALGGVSSVRGYHEGEVYGDSGWRVSAEPRTPFFKAGSVEHLGKTLPIWLRGSAFLDYGEAYLEDPAPHSDGRLRLGGAGFGASASIGEAFDARFLVAWPLVDSPTTRAGQLGVYFVFGAQF